MSYDAVSSGVIIFGSGQCAQKIAANLADNGVYTLLSAQENVFASTAFGDKTNRLDGAELVDCKGFAGRFELDFKHGDTLLHKKADAIVVAEDHITSSNYISYGLRSNARILDISSLEEKINNGTEEEVFKNGSRIAFLCGWKDDTHPAVAQRMLKCCLQLQRNSEISTFFMTGNLKVAANGAEAIYQQAKRSGAVFFKFTQCFPSIETLPDGRFEIEYQDEMTRNPYQLIVDWIVVDETPGPGPRLNTLANRLEIESDHLGFAQRDNVHRLSNATNRRGVFVAGGARGAMSKDELMADADQVSVKILAYLRGNDGEPLPEVEIQRDRCARCLTCYRLCPHKAIEIGKRISVVTQACQSCGICLAGCPARAIDMEGLHINTDVKASVDEMENREESMEKRPHIMVFGCSRSAGQAHKLTRLMGYAMPAGVRFIEVPCGGTISSRNLLAAFDAGADGVMLCTCHTDNCKSDKGNLLARKRAESALDLLTSAGVKSDRLTVISVAANMGNEFYRMINDFCNRINELSK